MQMSKMSTQGRAGPKCGGKRRLEHVGREDFNIRHGHSSEPESSGISWVTLDSGTLQIQTVLFSGSGVHPLKVRLLLGRFTVVSCTLLEFFFSVILFHQINIVGCVMNALENIVGRWLSNPNIRSHNTPCRLTPKNMTKNSFLLTKHSWTGCVSYYLVQFNSKHNLERTEIRLQPC